MKSTNLPSMLLPSSSYLRLVLTTIPWRLAVSSLAVLNRGNIDFSSYHKFSFKILYLCLPLVVFGCSTSGENITKLPEKTLAQQDNKAAAATTAEVVVQTNSSTTNKLDQRQQLLALPNKYQSQHVVVQPEVKRAVKTALTAKDTGDIEAAKTSLEQLAINHPTLSGIKLHLGDIAMIEGDLDKAKGYYQQVIAVNPDNYFAYNRLGSLHRQQGSFDQAKTHYQAALTSWPAFAEAHLNLGILFDLYLGDKAAALHHYQIYQVLSENSNRKVKSWIFDVSAQLKKMKGA